jgi:hypothetical protein
VIRRIVQLALDRYEEHHRRKRAAIIASKFAIADIEARALLEAADWNETLVVHALVMAAWGNITATKALRRMKRQLGGSGTIDDQIAMHRAAISRHLLEELRAQRAVLLTQERGQNAETEIERYRHVTARRLRCEAALEMQLAAKERKAARAERVETRSTGDRASVEPGAESRQAQFLRGDRN